MIQVPCGCRCRADADSPSVFLAAIGCMDIDPKQDYCYCHKHRHLLDHRGFLEPPKYNTRQGADPATGLCTSVVANTPQQHVLHGRNMDWNIPPVLRKLVIDVEFQRSNRTVFTGTTIAGFVGVLNGMTTGPEAWSISMDARGKGAPFLPFEHGRPCTARACSSRCYIRD